MQTPGGALTITGFSDNTVHQNTVGSGARLSPNVSRQFDVVQSSYDKNGEFTPITWKQAFDIMEEKFKEAAEAYEILSDPDRRRTYDAYGHDGLRSNGFASAAGAGGIG